MSKRPSEKRFRPRFESLETRQMMAITATLEHGVLAIIGSATADTATITRAPKAYSIAETGQTFSAKAVKAIDIALLGGDDVVQLNKVNKKSQPVRGWIGTELTASADLGTDTLHLPNGVSIYFGGIEQSLVISKAGNAKVNGQDITWFDTNIVDSTLRYTAKQSWIVDKVLGRTDMMGLFDATATSGTVSTREFDGMQKIVNNKGLFKSLYDVQTLSSYVVDAAVANEYYGQTLLGNLEVGSTKQHLTQLVDKWFLGTDLPQVIAVGEGEIPTYREVSGQLFVGGVSYDDVEDPQFNDINQGELGDCYYLAALAAVALKRPKAIKDMFVDNGDGTYAVRFYDQNKPYQVYYVTINSELPTNSAGKLVYAGSNALYTDPKNELWVALAEKAYAQVTAFRWIASGSGITAVNDYAKIEGGSSGYAISNIVGAASSFSDDPGRQMSKMIQAFIEGRPVALSSIDTTDIPSNPKIPGNHAYVMIGYDAGKQQLKLFNPWGTKDQDRATAPGIFTVSKQELSDWFDGWYAGPKLKA